MIYITQFIYVKPGKEAIFLEFEDFAIPLMEEFGGELLYRIRPSIESFIAGSKEPPYEMHFIRFATQNQLDEFLHSDARLKFMHLKDESVSSTFLVTGEKM